MKNLSDFLSTFSKETIAILDTEIPIAAYTPLDLSFGNVDLESYDITDPNDCQTYIDRILKQNNAQVAYGGYLEKRNLYNDNVHFLRNKKRNIHLGIDFWAEAGTKVLTPLAGIVHSFKNNAEVGNYGPTIILQHKIKGILFYSLYGHLSINSLNGLSVGKTFQRGNTLATLGTPDINVNYAPHLHFQLIQDMQGKKGDYPGVSSIDELEYYRKNCPNPSILLRM